MRRKNKPRNGNNGNNDKSDQLDKEYWWEARASIVKEQSLVKPVIGRPPKFQSAEILWQACTEYFRWVEDNPLYEDRIISFQGKATHEPVAKMRAMTFEGLWLFLDISHTTWARYKKKNDFSSVTTRIETIIRKQKFEGAAADLLNPNIIARDLGLTDKQDITSKGEKISPINITVSNNEQRDKLAGIGTTVNEDD